MKAIVDQDIIVNITELGNVEIGTLPDGVGFERLRWDGNRVVDLADLSEIWVANINGSFELHCMEVPGSQLVQMTYADRKKLTSNSGTFRIKTQEEIDTENTNRIIKEAKAKLQGKIGNLIDLELAQLAFICALIVYARQQPTQLGSFFDSLIPNIIDTFPLNKWETVLTKFAKDLNKFINEYYNEIDLGV